MDPSLYSCIMAGDMALLKEIKPEVLLKETTVSKNTALHVAIQLGKMDCAEHIYSTCPSLAFKQNLTGDTALHVAARQGRTKIVKLLLISPSPSPSPSYNAQHEQLIRKTNYKKDTALHLAVRNHHLEVVKLLTEADPRFEYYSNNNEETPLYLAAEDGLYDIVQQILTTCPSSACVGPQGLTALHAAILRNQSNITNLLLKNQPGLIKQADRYGWTPLHCAARIGAISLIQYITRRLPDCWYLVDQKGCNFLHVAAMYQQDEVVKHVSGTNEMPDCVLNVQNDNGDTPLHLAARAEHKSTVLCLLSDHRVNKSIMNNENLTAVDVSKSFISIMERKGGVKSRRKIIHGMYEQWKERPVNTELVVDADISEGSNQGTTILSRESAFQAFVISNTFAMLLSLCAIFCCYLARVERNADNIHRQVGKASLCILFAMFGMVLAFATGSYIVLGNSLRLAVIVCTIGCIFFFVAWRTCFDQMGTQ